jgi:AcrR family transcriptional regulator
VSKEKNIIIFDRPFSQNIMSPKTIRQFEEIREQKRRQILNAAIECFASSGYHAVSISELAEHAGISKGLLYHYFTSKSELLKFIFREIMSVMTELFDSDGSPKMDEKLLGWYFENLIRHMKSNLLMWKMHMAIFSQPAVRIILQKEIEEASKKSLQMMEQYFRKKGYKNPSAEVAFLSTLMSGMVYEFVSDPENYPLDHIKRRILRLYTRSSPGKRKK